MSGTDAGSEVDILIVEQALRFATEKHLGQFRNGTGGAYIKHPIETEKILREEFGFADPYVCSAALLHDVLEDTNTTYAQLYQRFGSYVAGIVDLLTKTSEESYRSKRFYARLALAADEVVAVKAADRISNLRSMQYSGWTLERVQAYLVDSRELETLVSERGLDIVHHRLREAIDQVEVDVGEDVCLSR